MRPGDRPRPCQHGRGRKDSDQPHLFAEAADLLAGRIAMAHAKDRDAAGAVVPAGSGIVDFDTFFAKLARTGFAGPVVTHGLAASDAAGRGALPAAEARPMNGGTSPSSIGARGPVVVFQHGLGGDETQVAEVFPDSPMAAGARLTLDCRGQGRSPPDPQNHYAIRTFAEDVLRLADAIGRSSGSSAGGISMGAAIALHLAVHHPEPRHGADPRPARLAVRGRARRTWRPTPRWRACSARRAGLATFEASEISVDRLAREAPNNLGSLRGFFNPCRTPRPPPRLIGAHRGRWSRRHPLSRRQRSIGADARHRPRPRPRASPCPMPRRSRPSIPGAAVGGDRTQGDRRPAPYGRVPLGAPPISHIPLKPIRNTSRGCASCPFRSWLDHLDRRKPPGCQNTRSGRRTSRGSRTDISRTEPYVDIYHIDVADGHFAPSFLFSSRTSSPGCGKPDRLGLSIFISWSRMMSCSARSTSSPRPAPISSPSTARTRTCCTQAFARIRELGKRGRHRAPDRDAGRHPCTLGSMRSGS